MTDWTLGDAETEIRERIQLLRDDEHDAVHCAEVAVELAESRIREDEREIAALLGELP
ncbi:MAG TPA: hypothetical protein VFB19_18665 [Mycobacterium sp.]|nr:hypothetical protein [Mycobacterium sp.]